MFVHSLRSSHQKVVSAPPRYPSRGGTAPPTGIDFAEEAQRAYYDQMQGQQGRRADGTGGSGNVQERKGEDSWW
jgi:hypothetical protein